MEQKFDYLKQYWNSKVFRPLQEEIIENYVNSYNYFMNTNNYNKDYRFSYEIIAQSYYLDLKISSVPTKCDYKGDHTTMPLKRDIPCIIHN